MLVLRKEIKIGIGAGLTILGIAAVYGLIAALSSGGPDANKQTAVNTGTNSSPPAVTDRGNEGGLPPVEADPAPKAGGVDPFTESVRKDGNTSTDPWANAFSPTGNTGRGDVVKPITVKAPPIEAKRDPHLLVDPLPPSVGPDNGATNKVKTTPPASGGTKYVVKPGDTITTIARSHYGSRAAVPALLKANPDVDPKKLRPGKEINLPPKDQIASVGGSVGRPAAELTRPIDTSRQYRIATGDTLSRISTKVYGTSTKWEELYEANKATIGSEPGRLTVGTVLDLPQKPVR